MESPQEDIILVVDDEPSVLRMVTTVLASTRYRAVLAEDGCAAWETFQGLRNRVRLVLTDMVMPAMGGLELAAKIQKDSPGVKVLLMTGYTDDAIHPRKEIDLPLIRKPFLAEDLRRRISEMLE